MTNLLTNHFSAEAQASPIIRLPYKTALRDWQKSVWQAAVIDQRKQIIICIPRRNGKDIVSLCTVVARSQQRVGLYYYMAPFYSQIRNILWKGMDKDGRRLIDYIPPQFIRKKYDTDMSIEFWNGSVLKLVGSDNIDSIVGNNPVGIVNTEYSLHKPEAHDLLRPVLAENGGWVLMNGTPRGMNHFYKQMQLAKEFPEDWFSMHLTRDDTGIPSLERIDRDRRSGMPEFLVQQEYYCDFNASTSDTIVPLDLIEKSRNTVITEKDYDFAPRYMGVDVAFSEKGDEAVIARRQGRLLHPLDAYRGSDNMALATTIANYIKTWEPSLVFIDAGRGEGVISRLGQLGYADRVVPVNFGSPASNEIYANAVTEMCFRVRRWFENPNPPALPDDPELIAQLSTRLFHQDEKRRILAESKKALRSRGKPSPDRAEAVGLTFAEEEYVDSKETELMTKGMSRSDIERYRFLINSSVTQEQTYDPLDFFNQSSDQNDSYYY